MGYDFQVNDRKEYDIRRGDDRDKPASDLNLQTHSISLDLNSKLTNTSNVKAGISARYQKNFPDPDTGIRRIIPDYKKYDLSFYSIYDSKINELFQFESGLRFDYSHMNAYKYYRTSFWESRNYNELFPEIVLNDLGTQILTNPKFNFYNLSANIGANYKIGGNKKIYFNYSMSSRNPNPSELFSEGLHHSAARIEIGDLRFNSEIGHNLSLSYELIGEKYNFTATSFINSINDYIYIMPTYLLPTIRGVFPVWEYRQENATLYGVDIKYDKKYNQDLSTGHQFSLIKGYLKNNNEPIINLPPANFKNYISYQFFNLNNLNISLESEYVFRQNEFPNNNFDVYIPTEETFELLDTSTPPNAYHLVNFNSSMEFILNRGNKLKLNFKVRNFFDTIYKDYLNRLRYFTHDLGRNFILSAKYSF
jgi:iron complex outermembrane receptor protein